MLNQLESLTEHVEGSNKLVDRWLHVRKHLLVAYYNLVGIKPGKESYMRLNEKALDDFCQGLVDYLSAGHFSIYEHIIREMEEETRVRPQRASIHCWKPILNRSWNITTPAWRTRSITIIMRNFSKCSPTSAKRWKRGLRWKINSSCWPSTII